MNQLQAPPASRRLAQKIFPKCLGQRVCLQRLPPPPPRPVLHLALPGGLTGTGSHLLDEAARSCSLPDAGRARWGTWRERPVREPVCQCPHER